MIEGSEVAAIERATPIIVEIWKRAAESLGMSLQVLEEKSRLLTEVRWGQQSRLLHGGRSPLNDAVASRIAEDKYYTSLVLQRAGFKTPQSVRCLKPEHFKSGLYGLVEGPQPAFDFLEHNSPPVVIKPNRLSLGRYISVVERPDQIQEALREVWDYDYIALAQNFVVGLDHRLDFLDGEFWAGYIRRPVVIDGDGTSSIRRLVERRDSRFASDRFWSHAQYFADWREQAVERGWSQESILPEGFELTLGGEILNLNRFALAQPLFEVHDRWIEFGRQISRTLGLRHLGVDFKIDSLNSDPGKAVIIEVNASPVLVQMFRMGYEDLVTDAYARILKAAFS